MPVGGASLSQDEMRSVNGSIEMILKQSMLKRKGTDKKPIIIAADVEAG